jgi:hypothetical protein
MVFVLSPVPKGEGPGAPGTRQNSKMPHHSTTKEKLAMIRHSLQFFLVAVAGASITLEIFFGFITAVMSTSSPMMSVSARVLTLLYIFTTCGGLMTIVFLSWFKWPKNAAWIGLVVCCVQMLNWIGGYLPYGYRHPGFGPNTLFFFIWQTSLLPAICLLISTQLARTKASGAPKVFEI